MTENDAVETMELVYLGLFRGSKRKRLYGYAEPGDIRPGGDIDEGKVYTFGKLLVPASVGAHFRFAVSRGDEGGITVHHGKGHYKYLGTYNDMDAVRVWSTRHYAVQGELDAEAKQATEMRRDLADEAFRPLRFAYRQCKTARQKRQLLAYVIERIVEGKL